MASLVTRDFARSRLRLGLRQSFRLLPSCYGAMISTDDILDLVNRSRRPMAEPFLDIPTDIMTADELAAIPELADSGITARKILSWALRRTVKTPPHLYLNKHTVRFSKSRFLAWLDALSKRRHAA